MNTRTRNAAFASVAVFTALTLVGCGADAPVATPAPTASSPAPTVTAEPVESPAATEAPEEFDAGFADYHAGADSLLLNGSNTVTARGYTFTCDPVDGAAAEEVRVWWTDPADTANGSVERFECGYPVTEEW